MSKTPADRWDNFTPWELQAIDELFRSFGPMRDSNADIGKLAGEIVAAMQRRSIEPFGSTDRPAPKVKAPPGPAQK